MLFTHVMVGSNDLAASKKFYDAVFQVMGINNGMTDAKGHLVYEKDGEYFMITKPLDGHAATYANGGTIGFRMGSPEQVDAWQAAGVANGGKAVEDPPGRRANGKYVAYLRDPDGNKLYAAFIN